jgi:hypothetical protein
MWEFSALPKISILWSSLDEGLLALLAAFQHRRDAIRHYQKTFQVTLWCGHFSSSFDGGPNLSVPLLKQLGNFGVELYIDTYFSAESKVR